ncbi:transcription termination factor Rho [Candidatus Nesciobacter abundans]|uniref:Transcription termination factor Rho n=1 Tax=Candidatus Nesciobacter abundans TaxID=2601668 RepID=A0A5C0UGS4_9PROT|nr:transcription termination factor Rho [Candidatus Nesciobacter abundans]
MNTKEDIKNPEIDSTSSSINNDDLPTNEIDLNKNINKKSKTKNNQNESKKNTSELNEPKLEENKPVEKKSVKIDLCKLRSKKPMYLAELAESLNININKLQNKDLLVEILRSYSKNGYEIKAYGSLEIINDSFGFIRYSSEDYTASEDDIYVPQNIIFKYSLRPGDNICCTIKVPEKSEKNYSIKTMLSINEEPPKRLLGRSTFESLTSLYPTRKINLEIEDKSSSSSLRALECIVPIGFGQRALIVAPPRTGKTILLQQIANAIHQNHPEAILIILLVGERPEEVTDMRRSVHGEVISSTFDEVASRHVKVAERTLEKAKRLVESKKDVVILLDSITRLARAYNTVLPSSGKVLTGGVDAYALQHPKKFFGSARNLEEGGSLTIIGTALVDTGSRMDDIIYEEFKGTGNADIVLERKSANKRIFPALDISKSGTRKEDLLRNEVELSKMWLFRAVTADMEPTDSLNLLLDKIRSTPNNAEFFKAMNGINKR